MSDMSIQKFTDPDKIDFYVYALVDPRYNKVFYIGKGKGNRAFEHSKAAIKTNVKSDKLDLIREIINEGECVKILIIKHGIKNEDEAYLVESVLIDVFNYKDFNISSSLTNIASGHGQNQYGIKTVEEVNMYYSRPLLDEEKELKHKLISVNINRATRERKEIYEATRKAWKVSPRRANKADYVLSERYGVIVAVYKIDDKGWVKSFQDEKGRWRYEFSGEAVEDSEYIGKRIKKGKGYANPIRYFNL
ncbi:MAG: excinuclease ABC [Rikenellaceae bacterium]